MPHITHPILLKEASPQVKALQDAMVALGYPIAEAEHKAGNVGASTLKQVRAFQKKWKIAFDKAVLVDAATAKAINEALDGLEGAGKLFSVSGRVVEPDGTPIRKLTVRAFDKALGKENLLGLATTDAEGRYTVPYKASQLSYPDKPGADLVVRVYETAQAPKWVAASPLILNALPQEVVNLVVGSEQFRGKDAFGQIREKLQPELDDINLNALTSKDVAYLANKTKLDAKEIARFVKASKHASATGIPSRIFYALFSEGLPTDLPTLLIQDEKVLRRALNGAVNKNVLPKSFHKEIDAVIRKLKESLVEQILSEGLPSDNPSTLKGLLDIAGLSPALKKQFLGSYVQHAGPINEFWKGIRKNTAFGESQTESLQLTLQLGLVAQNHLPLVKILKERQDIGNIKDLLRLEKADWLNYLGMAGIGVPQHVPGKTADEKKENYTNGILDTLEMAFPTPVFAKRLLRDDQFGNAEIKNFFAKNPDFEITKTGLDQYLKDHSDALDGVADKDALLQDLAGMERLFLIVPNTGKFENLKALWDGKYRSAHAIMRSGEETFRAEMPITMTNETVREIRTRAKRVANQALTLEFKHSPALNQPSIAAIANGGNADDANLTALFGSLDYCHCAECRSVLSPAAYLVDLLLFLKDARLSGRRETALDILIARRPDIVHTQLSCKNTHTPIPYIDLVIEVLENAVHHDGAIRVAGGVALDTTGIPEDLKANPEHINPNAYQRLRTGKYLIQSPFNLWLEEARIYLNHLGVPRYKLMEVFQRQDGAGVTSLDIALEYLGIVRAGENPIPIIEVGTTLDEIYPVDEWRMIRGDEVGSMVEYLGLDNRSIFNELTFLPRNLPQLLDRTRLSFEELKEILENVMAVNPDGLRLGFLEQDGPENTVVEHGCSLEKACFCKFEAGQLVALRSGNAGDTNLFRDMLDRLHRFIRLRNRLGWSTRDLHQTLNAFQVNFDLSEDLDAFVQKVADVKRLQAQLHLPLDTLLTWWSNIDTADFGLTPSPYRQLFLAPTVNNPLAEIFRLKDDGSELNDTSVRILPRQQDATTPILPRDPDHTTLIQGAVGLSVEDIKLLFPSNGPITLANLSQLYRVATFVKAIKLKVSEYLSLRALTGIEPIGTDTSPSETRAFLALLDLMRDSGFSVAELDYILRHRFENNSPLLPSDTTLVVFLEEMRAELQKVKSEFNGKDNNVKEAVKHKLGLMFSPDIVNATMKLIHDLSHAATQEAIAVFSENVDNLINIDLVGLIAPDNAASTIEYLTDFFDHPVFAATVAPLQRSETQRLQHLLVHLNNRLLPQLVKNSAIQKLTSYLGLTAENTQFMVEAPLGGGSIPLIESFVEDAFVESSGTIIRSAFDAQFNALHLLHKVAVIVQRLKIKVSDLRHLYGTVTLPGYFNLALLPTTATETADYKAWWRILRLFELNRTLFKGETSAIQFIVDTQGLAIAEGAYQSLLSGACAWDQLELASLISQFLFPSNYPVDQLLTKLRDAFGVLSKLGVRGEKVWSWNTPAIEQEQAVSIKNAAKAKYENSEWLRIAPPLRDELRKQQSSALKTYLLANHPVQFRDEFSLYEHFLIDTEMSACAMTSRIKQAIASIQLLVQRILMNLENTEDFNVEFSRETAQEWKWRRYYRVWEANRKVFLWPENWIEPELRLDQTPFFKDLESELLQDDVTDETVERAYLNYLEKLDEVARLDIRGMYKDEEQNILHVFGRTTGTPHIYYYRQWIAESYWTPWERVDLDILGDHLIPVVWNRRVYLFWPIFNEKAIEEILESREENPRPPKKFFEIQLAWSENKIGKWSPKKMGISTLQCSEMNRAHYFFNVNTFETMSINLSWWRPRDGYEYKHEATPIGSFNLQSCNDELDVELTPSTFYDVEYFGRRPCWTKIEQMKFHQQFLTDDLFTLRIRRFDGGQTIFDKTPKKFTIAYCPQNFYRIPFDFFVHNPFCYEDENRVFFVQPKDVYVEKRLRDVDAVLPNTLVMSPAGSVASASSAGDSLTPPHLVSSIVNPSLAGGNPIEESYFTGLESEGAIIERRPEAALPGISAPQTLDPSAVDAVINDSINPRWDNVKISLGKKLRFHLFQHPFVCLFIQQLNRFGIEGLLSPTGKDANSEKLLRQNAVSSFNFDETYAPNPAVVEEEHHPVEDIDFSYAGAYSQYNWELFFHAPLLLATRLSQNQKFEEAHRWFHYIFDPTQTVGEVPHRFWMVKPFHEFKGVEDIAVQMLRFSEGNAELEKQIEQWEKHPFEPHIIAQLRPVAYMRTVVMKYIDHLIAWGDYLFQRDTIESINEATQLYILAAQLLGRKPVRFDGADAATSTFFQIKDRLDPWGNALGLESKVARSLSQEGTSATEEDGSISMLNSILYFCVPANEKLFGYWDIVADRLFKIRNCMNIEGVVRQLPLFEPPIDPALLVRAVAAGIDLNSALHDFFAPLPHYRFQYMLQKALELCNDVQSIGASLLAALEKKDGEELSLLRAGQERSLLEEIKSIKETSIKEAEETYESLLKSKEVVEIKKKYYAGLKFMNPAEITQFRLLGVSAIVQAVGQGAKLTSVPAPLLPTIVIGGAGISSPVTITKIFDGANVAKSSVNFSEVMMTISSILSNAANMAGTMGGYQRRKDDWDLQVQLATKELEQINKQLIAAEIRKAIAEKDLHNHERQIENAQEVEAFLKDKFTNRELYSWMVSQISTNYFQSYQIAFNLAKRVEKSFQHELGTTPTNFIQAGYWDSLKKGLLSGERLRKDLRRMEVAYLEQNKREFELTKHVSLSMLDPLALMVLRATGTCEISIPEELFDLDYPGHYMRRIKAVSVSIPCVAGPFTNVSCTATMLSNKIRKLPPEAPKDNMIGIQSIATSNGQNDSGVFELNFRDERYLPFEGAGVDSEWRLELGDTGLQQFDWDTITDVVLHIRYTAREDQEFKVKNVSALNTSLTNLGNVPFVRLFSLRHDFPNEYHVWMQGGNLTVELRQDRHFPYWVQCRRLSLQIVKIHSAQNVEGSQLSGASGDGPWNIAIPSTDDLAKVIDLSTSTAKDLYLSVSYQVTGGCSRSKREV